MFTARKALLPALGLAAGLLLTAPAAADTMSCGPISVFNLRCSVNYTGSPAIRYMRADSLSSVQLSVQHSISSGRCDSPAKTGPFSTSLAPKSSFVINLPAATGTSATLTACASVTFACVDVANNAPVACTDALRVTAY